MTDYPVLLIPVKLCNLRAAEACSAEATELPVWKRPPVSAANGFCHPPGLPCIGLPKSVRQRQRSCLFGRDLRSLWQTDFATPGHWITAQITPPNRFALWRGPRQPGMTRHCSLGGLVLATSTINTTPRHHDTMSSRHHVIHGFIIAPIYYGGLICIDLPDRGLPAVILNLVRDDLRMMAPKPVAARDGAITHYADCIGLFMRLSSN